MLPLGAGGLPPIVGSADLSVGSDLRIVGGTSRSVSGLSNP